MKERDNFLQALYTETKGNKGKKESKGSKTVAKSQHACTAEVRKPRRTRGFHSRTASLFDGGLLPEDASSNASVATTVDVAALDGADGGCGGGAGAGAPADAAPPLREASGAGTVPRPRAPVHTKRSLNGWTQQLHISKHSTDTMVCIFYSFQKLI